jgi:dolichyl-phosphate-mannose-protein mannosyltransferase
LDGQLMLWTAAAVYAMVRFNNLAHAPFTFKWWFWLAMTGIALGLALR